MTVINRTFAALAACAALAAPAAHAQDQNGWMLLGRADDGTLEYVQPGADSDAGYKRLWNKATNDPQHPGLEIVSLVEIDCAEHRIRTLQVDAYRQGDVVDSGGPHEWTYITPGTVGHNEEKVACP
jgi:hypothetical protein